MSRILVVDDDGHIRDVMRFTLQQGGFQVVEAKDGAEALSQFSAGGIDLVVLDIVMPESDGLEVCRKIRAQSRLPIIFVSSRDEQTPCQRKRREKAASGPPSGSPGDRPRRAHRPADREKSPAERILTRPDRLGQLGSPMWRFCANG